jgi:hypothetical protein
VTALPHTVLGRLSATPAEMATNDVGQAGTRSVAKRVRERESCEPADHPATR